MAEPSNLREKQLEFSAYIRDPENQPAPQDIEARRMHIYADLFFNNVRKFLAGHFPVLSGILGEERWALLVRDYYRDHHSHSPLFPEMAREFLIYLTEERAAGTRTDTEADLEFMTELAHYEWVESVLMLAADEPAPDNLCSDGDLLNERPVLSGLAQLLTYTWPVDQIGKDHLPAGPAEKPRHYLVYRGNDEDVHFLRLNPVSARLFEILRDSDCNGQAALETIATEMQHPEPNKVLQAGAGILEQWLEKGIITGTLPGE